MLQTLMYCPSGFVRRGLHQASFPLKAAAESSILHSSQHSRTGVAGWSQFVKSELEACRWWYKLRIDAGSPSAGVLFQLKKHAYRKYI